LIVSSPLLLSKQVKMPKDKDLIDNLKKSDESRDNLFEVWEQGSWIIDSTGDDPKYQDDCGCGREDSCDT
tara:strand:+ start:394 stop:603 length:210 start_codon:yes stop_codon:yes gene_type:complete